MQNLDSNVFSSLRKLIKLDLSHNLIREIRPPVLEQLASVRELNLTDNQLEKLSPFQFANLTSLQVLDLSNNRLSKLNDRMLGGLAGLKELRLRENQLVELLSSSMPRPLENLTVLDVSGNRLDELDADFFSKLPKLERLDLSRNHIESLNESHFKMLANLKHVKLNSNGLSVLGDYVFRSMDLIYLDLSNNVLSDIAPNAFYNTSLSFLEINNVRMDIAAFRKAMQFVRNSLEISDLNAVINQAIEEKFGSFASSQFSEPSDTLEERIWDLFADPSTQAPNQPDWIKERLSKKPITFDSKDANDFQTKLIILLALAGLMLVFGVLLIVFDWQQVG